MHVPLLDLTAQYAKIKEAVLAQVNEVLDPQRCIGGPKVEGLEKEIASMSDCAFAAGMSSGTDALLNSLMSLEIGDGDE
ncbi:MAG: DegT/DnrJ/EryC1/StrS aminotransferase family protein, partial [Planctomycetes bacterium]|nr:DegT/DnrJ/EryC1/StrS aminotransferase family protein [Planctomycetota bacterium]